MFTSPILFIVFNRPVETEITFQRIREMTPPILFIAADGPRHDRETDAVLCKKVREIVTSGIDWDCQVKTLFRDQNIGCRNAVNEAIDWFFDSVEEGIILEDDILPSKGFFHFCELNLARYRIDERVMMVSGFNHLGYYQNLEYDYFFSQLGAIWGWASWRRAWKLNNKNGDDWNIAKKINALENILFFKDQIEYRKIVTEKTFKNEINTWDYIWTFYRLVNSGLSIIPCKNLIENIGFSDNATHTTMHEPKYDGIKVWDESYDKLKDPQFVFFDKIYDKKIFDSFINFKAPETNNLPRKKPSIGKRILLKIKSKS